MKVMCMQRLPERMHMALQLHRCSRHCPMLCLGEQVDDMGVKRVWAVCEDGRRFEGDLLIGADGIWSKVCE